jgi:TPR repeat protein
VGIERDYLQAANWFRRSATQGNAYGQHALGLMYRDAMGMAGNPIIAYAWLDLAAKAEFPKAAADRDKLAGSLTPSELEKARGLAAAWAPGQSISDFKYAHK